MKKQLAIAATVVVAVWLLTFLIITGGCTATQPDESEPGENETLPPVEQPAEEWVADGVLGEREYSDKMVTANDDFEIRWFSDGVYIHIGIKAKTRGWVAVGFEPSFRMKDADMVFGLVKDGQPIVSDQFSTGDFGPHTPDIELGGTDDILDFGGKEDGGLTVIEFKRALDTGDQYDKVLGDGMIKIIWSFGSNDEITQKHVIRGAEEIIIKAISK